MSDRRETKKQDISREKPGSEDATRIVSPGGNDATLYQGADAASSEDPPAIDREWRAGEGIMKITDFGIATVLTALGNGVPVEQAAAHGTMLLEGGIAGTPVYMPPE